MACHPYYNFKISSPASPPETYMLSSKSYKYDNYVKTTYKTFLKNFMTGFNGWCSTASRSEPVWGGSLLFTTRFPEFPGTHFIDIGSLNLGATQWFRMRDPWIGDPPGKPDQQTIHCPTANFGPLLWGRLVNRQTHTLHLCRLLHR